MQLLRNLAVAFAMALVGAIGLGQTTTNVVKLPAGPAKGVAINYTGWIAHSPLRVTGKDVVLQGQGVDVTVIDGGWDAGATITIGDGSGRVEIRDCTIVCGQTFGILYGSKRGDWNALGEWFPIRNKLYDDSMLVLRNVKLVTRAPATPGRKTTKWPVSTENVDHDWYNVEVDCPDSVEHCYVHGYAKFGVLWRRVNVVGIGAEALKLVCRPWESFFVPNARLIVQECTIKGFAESGAGGGIVLQGPSLAVVLIERSILWGRDRQQAACLRFDDGLSVIQSVANNLRRRYDVDGVESGPGPDIGSLIIRQVGFKGTNAETMRVGTIYPGYEQTLGVPHHNIVGKLLITQAGAYGANSRISLSDVGSEEYRTNNVDPVKTFLESEGFNTGIETYLGGKPLSIKN